MSSKLKFINKTSILVSLVALSIILTLLSPLEEIRLQLSSSAPFLIVVIFITEISFIIGLLVMAYSVGHDLGTNVLKWKKQIHHLTRQITNDKVFWIGFWINAFGAFGSTAILVIAAIYILPPQSLGLISIGLIDLLITYEIRREALSLKKEFESD